MTSPSDSVHEVVLHDLAVGGDGVGRLPDGRVVFVPGGAPDDRLAVALTEEKRRFARGRIIEILDPSPNRVVPPCPLVEAGCGGCDWQHLDEDAQADGKIGIVESALARLGGVDVPEVRYVAGPDPLGYRTTVRFAVSNGTLAYRRRSSNDLVEIDACLIAHPLMSEIIEEGRFDGVESVTVRVGARTGDRLVYVEPDRGSVRVPEGVTLVGRKELRKGVIARFTEEAAGVTWSISARSFFQSSPEGAEMLVALAAEWLDEHHCGTAAMVDLYAGVGLFSGTIGDWFDVVTAVESSTPAVADARINLNEQVTIRQGQVEQWVPTLADVVIADPPRAGLKQPVVDLIAATQAPHLVLVSCDAGALGRDAGLLDAAGYALDRVDVLDMFPQTSHVEAVTCWVRR